MSHQEYRLPDLLRDWPWTRRLSPYYVQAKAESSAWIESFRPFDSQAQMAFNACDFNLFACLTYSTREKDFVRVGCDLMNFFSVFDEYTDVADVAGVKALASTVISVMKNPEAEPENSHFLGEMTRQFWRRASTLATPGAPCVEHLIETMEAFVNAVTKEADDRINNRVRPLEDFLRLRRQTCGGYPTLGLCEFGLNLPNEVILHPVLVSLTKEAVELLLVVNDLHSYSRESSAGGNHNIIPTIMAEYNLGLQDALIWLETYTNTVISRFLSTLKQIPSWDPDTDRRVQMYIDGLGQWVRGNDDWSLQSKRYYGNDGLRVQEDRIVRIQQPDLPWLDIKAEGSSRDVGKSDALATKDGPHPQVN